VLLPDIAFHQHCTILQSNQLWDVDTCHSAVLHNTRNLRQGIHSGLSEALFDEAKAQVRGKLKVQIVVELVHGPPGTIPENKLNVLATAVITIQVHMCFPNSIVEEIVHVGSSLFDDCMTGGLESGVFY
jgi:hypothetical protein